MSCPEMYCQADDKRAEHKVVEQRRGKKSFPTFEQIRFGMSNSVETIEISTDIKRMLAIRKITEPAHVPVAH